MKTVFLVFGVVLMVNSFTPKVSAQVVSNGLEVCFVGTDSQGMRIYKMGVRCEDVRIADQFLTGAVLALSIGSLYTTASGVGVPITVAIGATVVSANLLKFMITRVDCEEDNEAFKRRVGEAVCEILSNNPNVSCDPTRIHIDQLGGELAPMCKNSSGGNYF